MNIAHIHNEYRTYTQWAQSHSVRKYAFMHVLYMQTRRNTCINTNTKCVCVCVRVFVSVHVCVHMHV